MASVGIKVFDIQMVVTEEPVVDHARKQIRDAAIAALASLIPTTVLGIYAGRIHPFPTTGLPALSVFTPTDARNPERNIMEGSGDRAQERDLEFSVEIRAKVASTASPDLISTLDAIALEVERAMETDATLAGLLKDLDLDTSVTSFEGESTEAPIGVLIMTWAAVYRCNPEDPAVLT